MPAIDNKPVSIHHGVAVGVLTGSTSAQWQAANRLKFPLAVLAVPLKIFNECVTTGKTLNQGLFCWQRMTR